MANHLQPTITSTYANFVTEMDARFDDLAVGLDPAVTSATNVPTNSIRWNSVSNKWQKYNGSTWVDLTASYAINISGSSGSAVTISTTRSNWLTNGTLSAVVGQLAWKNYGNGHTIFDASAGTSPDGTTVSSVTPANAWSNTYPTLMGWNGSDTYGVRVDSSRVSDSTAQSVTFNSAGSGAASGTTFNGGTARTISYNTIGAPSTSGANASGNWGINISGTAASATALANARNINGVSFDGTAAIDINLNNSITFNNAGSGAASGTTFNGGTARTISYNTVGAPSATGGNASGSWAISITGNATSATKLVTASWIVEESGGVLQIKTSDGTLKFSMDSTSGFTIY